MFDHNIPQLFHDQFRGVTIHFPYLCGCSDSTPRPGMYPLLQEYPEKNLLKQDEVILPGIEVTVAFQTDAGWFSTVLRAESFTRLAFVKLCEEWFTNNVPDLLERVDHTRMFAKYKRSTNVCYVYMD